MAATEKRRRGRIGMVAAGIGALAGTAARAQTTLDFRALYYEEGDYRTKVINPEMLLAHDFGEHGQLGLLLAYDSISGASPTGEYPTLDATATASSSGTIPVAEYKDTRKAASLSYSRRLGSHIPSVSLSYSKESDYLSEGVSLVDSWELFGKRSTFHLGVGILQDKISPVNLAGDFDKDSLSLSAGWTQVVGPRDLLDFSYGLTRLTGYLNDPYKLVTVAGTSVPEVRPDNRSRNTAVIRHGHYYPSRLALKTSYRYYWDDWQLKAHTLEMAWDKRVGQKLILSPRLRFYQQGAASFFGYEFTTPEPYMSGDYRLSSFWSWLVGMGFRVDLSDSLAFTMEASYQDQTGQDRVTPLPAAPVILSPSGLPIALEEDDDEGEGGPESLSPADLQTITVTLGLSFKF